MIYFNTFPNSLDRHEAKELSVEEIQEAVNIIVSAMKDAGCTPNSKETELVQNLIFNLENLMHFKSNAGGWEGLAKLQEIADSVQKEKYPAYKDCLRCGAVDGMEKEESVSNKSIIYRCKECNAHYYAKMPE